MIQYFFIIDFLESVVMQRPKEKKSQFSSAIKNITKRCVEHCKTHEYRYIDEITIQSQQFKVLARSTEDNIIVGVLVDFDVNKRAKIWKMIDEVINILSGLEDKEDGIKDVKDDIDKLIQKAIEPDTTDMINSSLKAQTAKVANMVNQQKIRIKDLENLDLSVRELESATEKQAQDSRSLYWEAYWYDKKLQLFITGAAIIVILFFVAIIYKMVPKFF